MPERLPIIYVRGFAGGAAGIDRVVDDPFYGFNEGSVHVRVDHDGRPQFHQFESPLLRLILEDGYELRVEGSQLAYLERQPSGSVPAATIWVHRFYDVSATTLARAPEDFVLERAAEDLFELVKLVLDRTQAGQVYLVAHSMGGLICRSMIQRVIPERTDRLDGAVDYVRRLFTYGTPHGGIEFAVGFGLLERLRDQFGVGGADIFGPDRMYEYLTPWAEGGRPSDWDPRRMPEGGFPADRIFCLIGTNSEDYLTALGLSARGVGARSDGLVRIDNAYVKGAHRAFVHRSHSGRYGMLNSEEGYQNLRRFLFGDLQVVARLVGLRTAGSVSDDIVWQLEVQLAIRGLPILMHEQTTAHYCPIQIERTPAGDTPDTPVPLLTTFLFSGGRAVAGPGPLRHALRVRLISVRERGGVFGFFDHLEQVADFDDTLVVDITPGGERVPLLAWAGWNSAIPGAIRDWRPDEPLVDGDATPGSWQSRVRLPEAGRFILGPDAEIALTVTPRT